MSAESDFTHMGDLAITLGGVPFPHLLFHLVLTKVGRKQPDCRVS